MWHMLMLRMLAIHLLGRHLRPRLRYLRRRGGLARLFMNLLGWRLAVLKLMLVLLLWLLLLLPHLQFRHKVHYEGLIVLRLRSFLWMVGLEWLLMLTRNAGPRTTRMNILHGSSWRR